MITMGKSIHNISVDVCVCVCGGGGGGAEGMLENKNH